MKQEERQFTAEERQKLTFNYLKKSGFFSIYCHPRGKTRDLPSKHEYSDKGLFANELNHGYFFTFQNVRVKAFYSNKKEFPAFKHQQGTVKINYGTVEKSARFLANTH